MLESIIALSFIINEKVGQLRDEQDKIINEIETWLNKILNQTESESKIKKERCEICNSKESPSKLQLHHIAGRKHDFRMITACLKCHGELSIMQKLWDHRWLSCNVSDNLRQAFFLLGISDILILKAKYAGNSGYEDLAISYTEKISSLLRGE